MTERDSKGHFVKGHKVSDELRETNRQAHLGIKRTEESRSKQLESTKNWYFNKENKKKFIEIHNEIAFKRRKLTISKEELYDLYINQKLSIRQIAKKFDVQYNSVLQRLKNEGIQIRSFIDGQKLNPTKLTEEGRKILKEKVSKAKKEAWKNQEYREKGLKNLEYGRSLITPEVLDRMGESQRKRLSNPEELRKLLKAIGIRPNKPETILINLFKELNLPFEYSGAGKVIVQGKCPDFIATDGSKRVIELHGRAYHDPTFKSSFVKQIPYHRTEKGTIEHYNKNGYKCLVIWDNDLNNLVEVLSRIMDFIREQEIPIISR